MLSKTLHQFFLERKTIKKGKGRPIPSCKELWRLSLFFPTISMWVSESLQNSIIRTSQENTSGTFKIIEGASHIQWLSCHILKWAQTLKQTLFGIPILIKSKRLFFYCSYTKRYTPLCTVLETGWYRWYKSWAWTCMHRPSQWSSYLEKA